MKRTTSVIKGGWANDEEIRAGLKPIVLGYAVNPVAMAAFWLLRGWHLVADEPFWVYAVVLWGGALLASGTEILFRLRPSRLTLHARICMQAAAVTGAIYATGWGPVLAIAYAFMAQENVALSGARTWRVTALWSVVWLTVGEVAIAHGVAPTLIRQPLVHGLAGLEALGMLMVLRMAGAVTAEKEQAEGTLRASEDRFRSLVQNSSDLTLVLEVPTSVVKYASEASTRLLGRRPEELVGGTVSQFVHPEDIPWLRDRIMSELAEHNTTQPTEFRVRHASGEWRFIEAVVANLVDQPSIGGVVINARDVTERKQAEAALEHQAVHDALTGLPNRVLFVDRLDQSIARAQRSPSDVPAVVFLDLDRFKAVNDSLGHDAGDELLVAVSDRLRTALRPGDTVARFGGDEFVLLCEGVSDTADAEQVAGRILTGLDAPFTVAGEEFQVSASLGVAMYEQGQTAADVVRDADAAMYRAKAQGRSRHQLFGASTREEDLQRVHTESALRHALDNGELRVHYQPIYELDGLRPVAVEALVRWEHPTRGLLPPAAFLDIAEDSGLIVPVGAWVLAESCRQVREWNAELGLSLGLSVNLSARQLTEPDLVDMVRRTLDASSVDPADIELSLEVTETLVLRDPAAAAARLEELRKLGVKLAIDDFGTGYSSLSYLRQFPVSTVKVDCAFVAGLGESAEDGAIVSAIVQLSHALGLQVVAEGVETEQQLEALQRLGCDAAQGFLLEVPRPAAELNIATCGVRQPA